LHLAATDIIEARGHRFVTLQHLTTIEITKEHEITKGGDCILAAGASKSAAELDPNLKAVLTAGGRLLVTIEALGLLDTLQAVGSEKMTFRDRTCLIIRKSSYVDERTVGILSNKAAKNIDRRLARRLSDDGTTLRIKLEGYLKSPST